MIRRLLLAPYRLWIRYVDLHHIETLIADEIDRHARHEATMRMLRAEAARLHGRLEDSRSGTRYGLAALRPRNVSVKTKGSAA